MPTSGSESSMPKSGQEEVDIPTVVTFTSGAALLVELGIVDTMTREGVRKIAKEDPDWPFGDEPKIPYGKLANAQTMAAKPFLVYFRSRKVRKRGPDRQPRKPRSDK